MSRVIACLIAALPLAAAAAPESYTIDPIHSFPYFSVDHLGFATIMGRFNKMAGKFTLDAQAKKAGGELTIEAASIDTADNDRGSRTRARDEHLRSADFFNVTEFPRVTYKATDVKFGGDNPVEISGQLTLLGITKPVTLKIDRWRCGPHPFSKKEMCAGNFSGSLKRTDFGMKFGVPAIGDEIRLMLGFEAYKD